MYQENSGSLGAAIGMMMWMWISIIVVLLGAQLNAEIEHQPAKEVDGWPGQASRPARRAQGRYDWSRTELTAHGSRNRRRLG